MGKRQSWQLLIDLAVDVKVLKTLNNGILLRRPQETTQNPTIHATLTIAMIQGVYNVRMNQTLLRSFLLLNIVKYIYIYLTHFQPVTPKLSSPIHMGNCVLVFVCLSNLVRLLYCLAIQILIENNELCTLTFTSLYLSLSRMLRLAKSNHRERVNLMLWPRGHVMREGGFNILAGELITLIVLK